MKDSTTNEPKDPKIPKVQLFNKSKSGRLPCKQAASAWDTPKHLWILGEEFMSCQSSWCLLWSHGWPKKKERCWPGCFVSHPTKRTPLGIVGYRTWSPGLWFSIIHKFTAFCYTICSLVPCRIFACCLTLKLLKIHIHLGILTDLGSLFYRYKMRLFVGEKKSHQD